MIYLASSSPRRAELLAQIGVQYTVAPAQIDESALPGESIERLVSRLSQQKALAAREQLLPLAVDDLVLAADTLIGLDGEIIGKPCSGRIASVSWVACRVASTRYSALSPWPITPETSTAD